MKAAIIIAVGIGLMIGLAIRDLNQVTHVVHHVETFVREGQTAPAEADVILEQLRKVNAISPTVDEHLLYECALTLQQHTGDGLGILLAYVHAYWEGDTCAALTHHLDNGWH
jgi:hypothetical protein